MSGWRPSPQHKAYVCTLYRHILQEAKQFFDDRSRTYIVNRARKLFKEYKTSADVARIKAKLRDARKDLHALERANRGSYKDCYEILDEAYGRKGKVRWKLLDAYIRALPADVERPEPFIAKLPHTAPPPPLCGPLRALVTKHLGKKLEPELPVPQYKPLHGTRKANLLWRWRSNLLKRVQLPVPFEIMCELETRAGAPPGHPSSAAVLQIGGPKWDDLYSGLEHDPDIMHLNPKAILVPKTQVKRRATEIPPSPYAKESSPFSTSSMLEYIDPSMKQEEKLLPPIYRPKPRQERRTYRKLLLQMPLLNPLPTKFTLWDRNIKYDVLESFWKPRSALPILRDPIDIPP
ncbi:hypothetical protein VTP01DRAFT_2610 [Rhizomucor pusillus]|uniref:uncharacterized protein n=1 Tax=Rhizomucor pusillus TaxID=4840 RepID=UPI0037441339